MTSPGFTEDEFLAAVNELHDEGHPEVTPEMVLERLSPGYTDASRRTDVHLVFPSAAHLLEQAGRTGQLPVEGEGSAVKVVFKA